MTRYMILKVREFSDLKAGGGRIVLDWPKGFPEGWCPVFNRREDAIAFNDGKEDGIVTCEDVKCEP